MSLIQNICSVATRWKDPEYGPRAEATEKTLSAQNRFTEEAIVFAVNQQMNLLNETDLIEWKAQLVTPQPLMAGVLNPGNIPMVELQDFLAVALSGHNYIGSVSSKSPFLFPAFLEDLQDEGTGDLNASLGSQKEVLDASNRLIASGSDEVITKVSKEAGKRGLKGEDCWLRGHRFSVAVLDGNEDQETLLALAEDVLMHEGMGCRSVAVVFAPSAMEIDGVLEAFAVHRSMFPAHTATTGTLRLQQAYLAAIQTPHAFADGHQFLISKGNAEEQSPCHVRWVGYDDVSQPNVWIEQHTSVLQCIYADFRLRQVMEEWESIGSAQRPALTWQPDRKSHISFLSR